MMLIVGVTVRFIPDLVSVSKKTFLPYTASSYFTASSQMVSSFD